LANIKVRLLGPLVVEKDGIPLQVDTRKALALLVYLAVKGEPQPRDLLAALLWPDLDQTHARSALRRTLSSLKHSLGGEELNIARESIGLNRSASFWIDFDEFLANLKVDQAHTHSNHACPQLISRLSAGVGLVRGEFLAGFSLRDSAAFDDWQILQAEALRQELVRALKNLSSCQAYLGEYEQAISFARQSQTIDPLDEEASRDLMRLYTWSGRRDAGLQQYHDLARMLESELKVSPSQETTQLYTEILENNLIPPHIPRLRSESQPLSIFQRSPAVYPLVGRQSEWRQLVDV
jgi:DNA-binding SARP family transcriptional activator